MPAWSDWRSVSSEGEIAESLLPCTIFQLRWLVQWTVDPPAEAFTQGLTGKWRWQIASGGPLFDSEVTVKATVVWFNDPFGTMPPFVRKDWS